MKKYILLLAVILCSVLVIGCGAKTPKENDKNVSEQNGTNGNDDLEKEPEAYSFSAQCIRTDGWMEGAEYPQVIVIDSLKVLQEYYENNREVYSLEHRDKVYSDTTIGFVDACEKFDEEYFEEHNLVMVLVEEGSGSIRHKVKAVRETSNHWEIVIQREVPEVGTDDMALWHILIEVQMGKVITDSEDVVVILE